MRRLAFLLLILSPCALSAQEGRIAFSRSVQYEFEIPERFGQMRDQIPTQQVSDMLLLFNAEESVMIPIPEVERQGAAGGPEQNRRAQGMATRLRMSSTSRSDHETLLQSHVRFGEGTMSEMREFMGREFLLSGTQPAFSWKLGSDQRQMLGYVVQKATAEHEGSMIEAWFTMQIPIPGGPGEFGGLPGMILLVSVDEGKTFYAATDVDLTGLGGLTISPPRDGEKVTAEQYETIVAERLAEVEMMGGASERRRRIPF